MENVREIYRRLDAWAWSLSRRKYAVLVGFMASIGSLTVGMVFGSPDYFFAIGIGLTLTVLYYLSNPNKKDD